jgi:hypothetical protein
VRAAAQLRACIEQRCHCWGGRARGLHSCWVRLQPDRVAEPRTATCNSACKKPVVAPQQGGQVGASIVDGRTPGYDQGQHLHLQQLLLLLLLLLQVRTQPNLGCCLAAATAAASAMHNTIGDGNIMSEFQLLASTKTTGHQSAQAGCGDLHLSLCLHTLAMLAKRQGSARRDMRFSVASFDWLPFLALALHPLPRPTPSPTPYTLAPARWKAPTAGPGCRTCP